MDISNRYCVYFGTTRGMIGNTFCETGKLAKYDIFDKSENAGISCMEWGRNQDEIIIGQNNGRIKLYNTFTSQFTEPVIIDGCGSIVGAASTMEELIIARKSGHLIAWNDKHSKPFSLNLSGDSTLESISYNPSRKNIIATGGECNDLKLWDVEMGKYIFKAKSMGHDNLNLPIPTSIRGITFLNNNGTLPACCTKEGYVLLYDDRVQRRPISKFIEPKASYTTIALAFNDSQIFVGTTKGYMQLLDMKNPMKCVKTFKSFTGSISSIVCDPIMPIVATVSLDRYLRIHDIETKKLLHMEYLKQSLTKLLLKPIIKEEQETDEQCKSSKNESVLDVDEEYEEIFKNMETVVDNTQTKRKSGKQMVKNFMAEEFRKSKKRKKVL